MQQQNTAAFNNECIDRVLPSDFSGLISQAKYDTIIDIILAYFKGKPFKIKSLENGILSVDDEKGKLKQKYSFFNLIRRLNVIDVYRWKPEIYKFLSDDVNIPAHKFFFSDFEHARKHLKVLVKRPDFMGKAMTDNMVTMKHFPGTVSCLVLNFDQKFTFLQNELIQEWNMSREDLFSCALENISKEIVHSKSKRIGKDIEYHIMMSPQYSAPRMIEIEKNAPHLIGECGTLFTMPANGLVFAVPYQKEEAINEIFEPLMKVTLQAFKTEPSPIGIDMFHYHDGEFSSMLDYIKRTYPDLLPGAEYPGAY